MSKYPLTLHHPAFKQSDIVLERDHLNRVIGASGTPVKFPPITVNNERDEEYYRSRGYRPQGESGSGIQAFHEYPKMLHHPEYDKGTPDEVITQRAADGTIKETIIKGRPEKFRPVVVNSREEEEEWNAQGYSSPGGDEKVFIREQTNPFNPNFHHQEYPKMVNGKIVDPRPNTGGFQEYPKMLKFEGGAYKIVNSREEENEVLAARQSVPSAAAIDQPKRRGRKPGSKNKPKEVAA